MSIGEPSGIGRRVWENRYKVRNLHAIYTLIPDFLAAASENLWAPWLLGTGALGPFRTYPLNHP